MGYFLSYINEGTERQPPRRRRTVWTVERSKINTYRKEIQIGRRRSQVDKMAELTNEQKQALKPLANTLDRETGRVKIKELWQNLSKTEQDAINNFQNVLDMKLADLKASYDLTNEDMYDLLRPFLNGANVVSKIVVPLCCTVEDRRHVGLKLMAAMRRVFGISIDELLDECFQELPDREPPKK